MDFLVLQKYGQETYQRKDYRNLYEYIQILNFILDDYLNRKTLNLVEFISLMKNSTEYYINFKEKYYELNPEQVDSLSFELNKAVEKIEKLKKDTLYQNQDEYYIFKFVDLIYNVKFLYAMYQKEVPILEKYYEFDIKIQNPQMVVLNKNESVEDQCFYYQQELKNEIKEYFKENLKDKPFSDILTEELDYLLMFPSTDFWLFGIYMYLKEIIDLNLNFLEYYNSYIENFKSTFLNDLMFFQKYDTYKDYTLKLLKEKNSYYIFFENYFGEDINYVWLVENFYKNNLIPKNYFLSFSKKMLKNNLDANQFIKIELYNLLNIAINTESVFDIKLLIYCDEILKAKLRKYEANLENSMKSTLDYDPKVNLKESGVDLLSVFCYLELINNNISIDDIPIDQNLFIEILGNLKLIETNIEEEIFLINNNIKKKDYIENKIYNYIKYRIGEISDTLRITECYNKFNSLPSNKNSLTNSKNSDNLPFKSLLQKQDEKNINFTLPKNNQNNVLNKINSQTKNNTKPNIKGTIYFEGLIIKNTLYMKNTTENLKEILEIFPIVKKLNGCMSLSIAQKNYEDNKNKISQKDLAANIQKNIQLNSSLEENNGIIINKNDPIQNLIKNKTIKNKNIDKKISPTNISIDYNNENNYFYNLSDSISSMFNNTGKEIGENFTDSFNNNLDRLDKYNQEINEWFDKNISSKIENYTKIINNWVGNTNSNMNTFLNSFRGFLSNYVDKIQDIISSITNFGTAILCAIEALLCIFGKFKNLGISIKKSLTDFKNTLNNIAGNGTDATKSILDNVNNVVDEILKTFGLNVNGICEDTSNSYLNNLSNELNELSKGLENQFLQNFKSMVDYSLQCKFKSPYFNFGRIDLFNFGFRPSLPPSLYFKVPRC